MSATFSPIRFKELDIANRIAVSPMCQYVAVDGKATSWHLIHYGSLAISGPGALFIESTAVEPEGRITHGDLGLWDEITYDALARVVDAVKTYSAARVMLQLGHAGRKASSEVPWRNGKLISELEGGWRPSAPSATPHHPEEGPPIALDEPGMRRVRSAFVEAARRAVRLGVHGIEIHAGHGYLLHQFLSPISNERTDQYGGSLRNRMRFPLEVFESVREVLPPGMPLGIKVSAKDWVDGGWDLLQSIELAKELKARNVDWVTASSGGISALQKISLGPGYQVDLAQGIREQAGVRTIAVGLITQAEQAEAIIAGGQADMVALARTMLYDPRWAWHAAARIGGSFEGVPPSYWRAPPQGSAALFSQVVHGAR